MKKFLLFVLLLIGDCTIAFGQDYEPFLKEGKTWEYTHRQPSSEDYYNFSRVVRGDTTINDLTYKKIYDVSTDAYQYALREEGKKVYCVFQTKDTPQLIYDFGDRLLRRMEVVEEYLENDLVNGSSNGIWIEGLGSSCGLVSPVLLDGNYNTFHSCWVGNKNYDNPDSGDANASESIYGEWWLVGWSDKGTWVQVDKKNVGHHSLSIEIPKEDYVMAYSMANEIFVGLLTLNGNEMVFGGEKRGGSTEVYCSFEENLFFEDHICDIRSYRLRVYLRPR